MQKIYYSTCPVCESPDLKDVFSVTDHTVSGESFKIIECGSCTLRLTQDVPSQEEIGRYYKSEEYISHTDTSKGLVNNLYQKVRKRTLRQKRKLIEKFTGVNKGYLLDVGSGTGAFVNEMTKGGWQVTGLEPDEEARNKAKQLYGLDLKSIESFYDMPASAFDGITLWHVLEHVHELNKYAETLKRILKPKGKIFIAVPNYTSGDAKFYGKEWAAYDVPRHLYHFSPESMKTFLSKHGMTIEKKLPMWYDSFYVSMLSSKYQTGKTKLISAFARGMRSNLKAWRDIDRCSSIIYVVSVTG